MTNLYDIAYTLGLALASPFWLLKRSARRKVFNALETRMGDVSPRLGDAPCVLIHAVSLGELNATRALINLLRKHRPDLHIVVTTTTTAGNARAIELYGGRDQFTVIRYPLDFTGAVVGVLEGLRPDIVVLMELEVWPNFLRQCARRDIPVVLANGRITEPSFRGYHRLSFVARKMFSRLAFVCAQDEAYARRFAALGVPQERLRIVGTMKFDTADVVDRVEGDDRLAAELGLWPSFAACNASGREIIWVCGSTGPGEEEIVLKIYRDLLQRFSRLRLVIVPRKPERFDAVAKLIEENKFRVVRRSRREPPPEGNLPVPPVILGDTLGELRKFYSLADLVFVGRSLVKLEPAQHGSDMIEPAALGKPIIVGKWTTNFAEAMRLLRAAHGVLEVDSAESLRESIAVLISTPEEALAMSDRARQVVMSGKGSTARHASVILGLLKK